MLNITDTRFPVLENPNEQNDKLKVQFPELTDENFRYEESKKDEKLTRVQDKTVKLNEEMGMIISALLPSRKLKNR